MNTATASPATSAVINPVIVAPASAHSGTAGTQRLVSIDALRGFDMFWIVGGSGLVSSFLKWILGGMPPWLGYHFDHPAWQGFSAWDLIMPLFLFIVGAAMPFSVGRRLEQGETHESIYLKTLRRVAVLWILGMVVQGNLLQFKWENVRFYSNTLQAIAAGYLIATFALVNLRVRGQVLLTLGLLASYALILALVPVASRPEGVGPYTPQDNLALSVDKTVFGVHQDGTTYTWVLSSLGFGATVLMGVLGGTLLKGTMPGPRKVWVLAGAGAGCLAAGWLLSFVVPIIKHIWTSSMALWAGGWSFLLLAVFYGVIDVLGFKRWSFPFVVIGANAIVAYVLAHVVDFKPISRRLLGGLAEHAGTANAFVLAAGTFGILWFLLWYLYRNRTFVRV